MPRRKPSPSAGATGRALRRWHRSTRRHLCEISRETNRQIGVLISRKGDIHFVVVGDHRQIMIPSLDEFRSGESRLKGLRLIHTHLNGEALTRDDLTDLALLRLDLVKELATELRKSGASIRIISDSRTCNSMAAKTTASIVVSHRTATIMRKPGRPYGIHAMTCSQAI